MFLWNEWLMNVDSIYYTLCKGKSYEFSAINATYRPLFLNDQGNMVSRQIWYFVIKSNTIFVIIGS